jgi:hypothetical protein
MIGSLNTFQRFKTLGSFPVIEQFLLMGETPFLYDSGNLTWQSSFGRLTGLYID